jgi:hypothetical protein
MPTAFVDAEQIVEELGLYKSIWAVHRAVKRGELPPGKKYGRRMLWKRDILLNPPEPKPRKIVRRPGS